MIEAVFHANVQPTWNDTDMKLEKLRALAPADQQIFLLGRIALETSRLDASLRFVHAALSGQNNVDAFLDAPDNFSVNVKKCRQLIDTHLTLNDQAGAAVLDAVVAARNVYQRRNRYTHDFLRKDLLNQGWELARLSRQCADAPEVMAVSFDDMVNLVTDLIAATWRLRGCAIYVLTGGWAGTAFGTVEGQWDGSATLTR
ncbi:hypothetical protein [Arthrobacter sp. H16F315]|uniref:hypothetical protein n=1 Tax=Arthrobacter sp. H16F315 TaxID=2955314 RepID=UPI0020975EC7|nr:hypothetical protein [Arthrobacter sp. H16F315]MDD1477896.1 hypothetical protein [Arthrobacter sp. H16F315]